MKLSDVKVGEETLIRVIVVEYGHPMGTAAALVDSATYAGPQVATMVLPPELTVYSAPWRPVRDGRVLMADGRVARVRGVHGDEAWVKTDEGDDNPVVSCDSLSPLSTADVVPLRKV